MKTRNILILLATALLAMPLGARDFTLTRGKNLTVNVSSSEDAVVQTALDIFTGDYHKVFDGHVERGKKSKADIVVRTKDGWTDKPQAFRMTVSPKGQLEITGSDRLGTAYGLMQLSRLIGVSPWEWWADVVPDTLGTFSLPVGYIDEQSPSVEFRGIFINDEDAGFMPWATKTFEPTGVKDRIGPKTHARMFELLLRLRANTFWPAMHKCSEPFFLTPGNREVARKYGIYIGTSHCEPMACNVNGEWGRRGKGEYNYLTNRENVKAFWQQRIDELREVGTNAIYTLGMRGIHDGAMNGVKGTVEYCNALVGVLKDQRQMLAAIDKKLSSIPQVFIPYKEVLDVYNEGLETPDDVTLLWCDDNYGYLTHFPTEAERRRSGGNGLYYHISYWGRPQPNTWLGSMSPSVMWQQLNLAYRKGMQRMWILNVGDLKPSEYLTELFLDMAWDIDCVQADGISEHGAKFLEREFGKEVATRLSPVMDEYARLTHIMRPEFTDGRRIEEKDRKWRNAADYPSWTESMITERLARLRYLSDEVERVERLVSSTRRDAYFQLVKFPVQVSAQMNVKYLGAMLARHGVGKWETCQEAHDSILSMSRLYNRGKWNRMMPYNVKWMGFFNALQKDSLATPLRMEREQLVLTTSDTHSEGLQRIEGLGYSGCAAEVEQGKDIIFDLPDMKTDSIEVEIRLLPTYPLHSPDTHFRVNGDHTFGIIENGRTEEWKRNVLRNLAIRRITMPATRHLTFTALDEGVVLDQIIIREK